MSTDRFAFTCPHCGDGTPTLYEGYCEPCREERQRMLDSHNAHFDRWEGMTDREREAEIRDAMRTAESIPSGATERSEGDRHGD